MMALEAVIKFICTNSGSMDYERLVEISSSLPEGLDAVIGNKDFFTVIQKNNCKQVILRTNLRLCRTRVCDNTCKDLHLCKLHLLGECRRRRCDYGHSLETRHNSEVLQQRSLHGLSKDQLRTLLLQSDNSLLPHVCVSYNKGSGEYGNCPDKEDCRRLHICEHYIKGTCDGSTDCSRCHDFYEPHPMNTLQKNGVPSQLTASLLQIYRNILALRDHSRGECCPKRQVDSNKGKVPESLQKNTDNVICLSFVKGYCKYGEKCWRIHFDMPYKWQVEEDQVWVDLPNNEAIEQAYCDPFKTNKCVLDCVEGEPVCFDTMTMGFQRVRRLSTESSVLEPNFVLTTQWIWYWENEYKRWIQFGSIREMHRLSSITSEELEQKYVHFLKDNNNAVVTFTAGKQFYELNFRDMKQTNKMSGTERTVKRRPIFVSSIGVQRARASKRGAHSSSHKGIPGFWDKSAVSDTGYQRVFLSSSDRDYAKVQEHFHKTMKNFDILTVERVQNKELWEDFQTKRDRITKANKDKKYGSGERLLFHGTKSMHTHAICLQNIDMRVSGANGTVYGEGSYFARDASYSHDYTDNHDKRSMFLCRILVGHYTNGSSHYRRPPSKDASGTLYDSCVNNVRDPTIFVVFDKAQIYPEFLFTYEEKKLPPVCSFQPTVCTLGSRLAPSVVTHTTPSSKPTALAASSHDSDSDFKLDYTVNVNQGTTMLTTVTVQEKYSVASSSNSTEPAIPSFSTSSTRNPLIVVLDSTVSEPKALGCSYPWLDDTESANSRPILQAEAKLSSSSLPSKYGQDLVAVTEDPVKSDNGRLVPLKVDLFGNAVPSDKASCISDLLQDSRKLGTGNWPGTDWDVCDDVQNKTLLFAPSSDPCPSERPNSIKTTLYSKTVHSEGSKNQSASELSCTSDSVTKPARVLNKTFSSFDSEFPDLEYVLDPLTTVTSSTTNTKLFYSPAKQEVSSSSGTNHQSLLHGPLTRSPEVYTGQTAFSKNSTHNLLRSTIPQQKETNMRAYSPPQKQKSRKSDCVVQ